MTDLKQLYKEYKMLLQFVGLGENSMRIIEVNGIKRYILLKLLSGR